MRPYKIKALALDDDSGYITKPDGSRVATDSTSMRKNGRWVAIVGYEYANMVIPDAVCSCGEDVAESTVCMILKDRSVLCPAKCCNRSVFFENVIGEYELDR